MNKIGTFKIWQSLRRLKEDNLHKSFRIGPNRKNQGALIPILVSIPFHGKVVVRPTHRTGRSIEVCMRPSFRDAPFRLLFISPNKSRNEAKRNDGKISKNRKLVDGLRLICQSSSRLFLAH